MTFQHGHQTSQRISFNYARRAFIPLFHAPTLSSVVGCCYWICFVKFTNNFDRCGVIFRGSIENMSTATAVDFLAGLRDPRNSCTIASALLQYRRTGSGMSRVSVNVLKAARLVEVVQRSSVVP